MRGNTPRTVKRPNIGRSGFMSVQSSCTLPQVTIKQIVQNIFASGSITRADQNLLRRAILSDNPITSEDFRAIQKVFDRLEMGLLKIGD